MAMVCICVHRYLGAILPHPQAGIQHGLVMLLTIEQYNEAVEHPQPVSVMFVPQPIGVLCKCGKELFTDDGMVYGCKPASFGVQCVCGQKGYKDAANHLKIVLCS